MKVNNWTIDKISEHEIIITNGWNCAYGYISEDKTTMYYDWIFFPPYIQRKALKYAQRNIKSIYAN